MEKYSDNSYIGLPVYRCLNCNLLVSGNTDDERRINVMNSYESYYPNSTRQSSIDLDFLDSAGVGNKRMFISQVSYCKPYFKDSLDLLEIGSGAGYSIINFEKMGFNVMGIEPDKRSVDLVNKKLKDGHCVPIKEENFVIDKKFDVIWMSHSFEHVVQPSALLKRQKNHLKKDGIIFIEVPNCENESVLKSSIYEQPSTFHYSKNSLLNLAKKTGLKIERCDFIRPPKKIDGIINRIFKNISNPFPFYPRISTDAKHGIDLRIILRNISN